MESAAVAGDSPVGESLGVELGLEQVGRDTWNPV